MLAVPFSPMAKPLFPCISSSSRNTLTWIEELSGIAKMILHFLKIIFHFYLVLFFIIDYFFTFLHKLGARCIGWFHQFASSKSG